MAGYESESVSKTEVRMIQDTHTTSGFYARESGLMKNADARYFSFLRRGWV
jgi:hypothetical protein